jgi:hypothetical protein
MHLTTPTTRRCAAGWLGQRAPPTSRSRTCRSAASARRHDEPWRIGVAIGDQVLDLQLAAAQPGWARRTCGRCWHRWPRRPERAHGAGPRGLAHAAPALSRRWPRQRAQRGGARACLVPQARGRDGPALRIGDYTDFYTGIHHATTIGKLFRPDNPLLPNYKWVPIGYHGRASSIGVSGTAVPRPRGPDARAPDAAPRFRHRASGWTTNSNWAPSSARQCAGQPVRHRRGRGPGVRPGAVQRLVGGAERTPPEAPSAPPPRGHRQRPGRAGSAAVAWVNRVMPRSWRLPSVAPSACSTSAGDRPLCAGPPARAHCVGHSRCGSWSTFSAASVFLSCTAQEPPMNAAVPPAAMPAHLMSGCRLPRLAAPSEARWSTSTAGASNRWPTSPRWRRA